MPSRSLLSAAMQRLGIHAWIESRISAADKFVPDHPLVVGLAGFSFGIWLENYWPIPILAWRLIATILVFAAGLCVYRRQKRWVSFWVLLSALGLGGLHAETERLNFETDTLRQYFDNQSKPAVVKAVVTSAPRRRANLLYRADNPLDSPWQTVIEARIDQMRVGKKWKQVRGKTTVVMQGWQEQLLPGDYLQLMGHGVKISSPSNPGERDLQSHYQKLGIWVRFRVDSVDQIEFLEIREGYWPQRLLGYVLWYARRNIDNYVSPDQAPLALALILGQRDEVDHQLRESLLATGTMHMLAISGLHIEMVAVSILLIGIAAGLRRRTNLIFICGVVILYAFLSGGNPPVIRAAILVVASSWGRWLGRRSSPLNLLALAGIILQFSYSSALTNVGTQLSFIAVITLCLFGRQEAKVATAIDKLDQMLEAQRSAFYQISRAIWRWAIEMIKASGWVWLVTSPIILSTFHVSSPISILLNVFLWPPLLVSLLSGLVVALLGGSIPFIGPIFGTVCNLSLQAIDIIVSFAEAVPFGHAWLPTPSPFWVGMFYGVAVAVPILFGLKPAVRKCLAAVLVLILGIMNVPGLVGPAGKFPLPESWQENFGLRPMDSRSGEESLKLAFIDVGHGTSVLMVLPDGRALLYDAGRLGDSTYSYLPIASVLWHKGLARLENAWLSHADSDHYNAFPAIITRFSPRVLNVSAALWNEQSSGILELQEHCRRHSVPSTTRHAGQILIMGDVAIRVLHPDARSVAKADNAASICLEIEYANRRILLLGDIQRPGSEQLMAQAIQPCDILMAPHHGSLSEPVEPILKWCQPKSIVISGGVRADRDEVIEAYQASNRDLWITHRHGSVEFEITSSGEIRRQSFVPEPPL